MSDPARPVEVSRLDLGSDNRPHWLAVEPGGTRIVLTGYRDLQYRVLMLQIDPANGRLSVDNAFRKDGASEAGLNFNRVNWPHGATGPARPHGAVFGPR
jgi:6-phosphogluconolactonase (cycloisomerase 2 family)